MKESLQQYKIVRKETVHDGFFKLDRIRLCHTLHEGGWSPMLDRELFRRTNCVAVLPYDPIRDQVVLIEQFRIGATVEKKSPWLLEIVAGAIEAGEQPLDVACREAREEAGCEIQELIKISEFYTSPGVSSERLTLFCGRVDARNAGRICGLKSENEDILVSVVDFDDAMDYVENGRIDSAIPIIALQWLALNRDRLRKTWN